MYVLTRLIQMIYNDLQSVHVVMYVQMCIALCRQHTVYYRNVFVCCLRPWRRFVERERKLTRYAQANAYS